jgi:hypothetical protein
MGKPEPTHLDHKNGKLNGRQATHPDHKKGKVSECKNGKLKGRKAPPKPFWMLLPLSISEPTRSTQCRSSCDTNG